MKNFFRTFVGKGILYTAFILSTLMLLASVGGAGYMIFSEYYRHSEEDLRKIELERYAANHLESAFYNWFNFDTGKLDGGMIADDGNFLYRITDENENVILTTYHEPSEYTYKRYITVIPNNSVDINVTEMSRYEVTSHSDTIETYEELKKLNDKQELYVLEGGLNPQLNYIDDFYLFINLHHTLYSLRYGIYFIGILSFAIMIVSFVALMCVSGRRPKKEEIVPWYFHKVPYELLIAPFILSFFIAAAGSNGDGEVVAVIMGIMSLFFPLLCMSTAVRIKTHTLIKNTIAYKVLALCWKGICAVAKNMKFLYKVFIALFVLMFFWLILLAAHDREVNAFFFVMTGIFVIPFIIFVALQINKLKKGAKELASGNFDHVIDTKWMLPEIRKHAEDLNNIAEGQKIAVAEKVKSERMKTELITNVSHDIKTPLTSIINYADLISKEETTSEKGKEYSEVLVRQSVRLKTLLEDLVEASKASTGNLEVDLQPCDAQVFVTQCAGEFEEKMSNANLTLVTNVPEQSIRIMADGRRMQRVFDNLLNNACKYSLPGTRVYVDLQDNGTDAVFIFKNTSKEPLNMSEEELMERFTRGDSSRNTEGSGLGLSIAGNLAELQKGTLRLSTDGDLFKATLTFPKI
ncbi:MAG: hypothetical protein J6U23_13575 [Clostridiales bacterium]|nr:hypothetical protein [Clostridiales bacterium]